ncbi:MAG: endonuclease/exonuclease/phosphatase family protein [Fibrella sp.]|nr:endonuclease/exonuclease/phosphatase family protein [Armatimonadota bacterium]
MSVNIATFNIRYDNPGDGVNAWPNRKEWVRDLMDYHAFDIVGVQEALANQVDFLAGGRFDYVGVGRDDGKRAGEFAALFYDRKRFARRESGTFWLSETPDVPSKGWDADLNRVCSWARLADKESGDRDFFVFNTHFDHKGVVARERSAELILARIKTIAGKKPFFLTGDFNLTPDTVPVRKLAAELRDSRAVTETKPYGPFGTANGFDINRPLDTHIDYIFVSPGIRVLKYAVLPDNWGLRYPSDHLPVLIRAEIMP